MIGARDDAELSAGLESWMAALARDGDSGRVEALRRPESGWSNETLLVDVARRDRRDEVVVRLPTRLPSFPVYDLAAQASVQETLVSAGLPAARVLLLEEDARWLGAPFVVMERVPGRPAGEVPVLDDALTGASEADQAAALEGFVACLAAVHRVDWRRAGLGAVLRGAEGVAGEVSWWREYVEWSASGAPREDLVRLGEWCASTVPVSGAAPVLCWGDARLGNVMFDGAWRVTALLDWELASIGPPEMDLAWYLVLDELTTSVIGMAVPGFPSREETIASYERCLGRALTNLGWHETFALFRAAAVYDRQARMAAELGAGYTGVEGQENPPLTFALARLDRQV